MLALTYSPVGATATVPPPGYDVYRTRKKLGKGDRVFMVAKFALERWEEHGGVLRTSFLSSKDSIVSNKPAALEQSLIFLAAPSPLWYKIS
jgi:uncharacterized protein (UPF0548 family)